MKQLFGGTYHHDELDKFLLELSGSVKQMEILLRDPVRCRFVPVMLAEALSTYETVSLVNELERLKVPITDIVVNKLYSQSTCPVCEDGRLRQMRELGNLPEKLAEYSLWGTPLYPDEVRGFGTLDTFWEGVYPLDQEQSKIRTPHSALRNYQPGPLAENPADFPSPEMTLFLFAGKGGVGKTTLACATALRIARDLAGKEVFLFSTDPAHSLLACLDTQIGPRPTRLAPNLTAMEIDATGALRSIKKSVCRRTGGIPECHIAQSGSHLRPRGYGTDHGPLTSRPG